VAIDADDIAGVVTSSNGPKAGVWVIAETSDLGTKYRKIVVTDDRGQYFRCNAKHWNGTTSRLAEKIRWSARLQDTKMWYKESPLP
jgi:hypothetical protein